MYVCMYVCVYIYIYIYIYTHISPRGAEGPGQQSPGASGQGHGKTGLFRTSNFWSRLLNHFRLSSQALHFFIRDPMRSSSFFHWRPWIRNISYREPFGEKLIWTRSTASASSRPWSRIILI